MSTSSLEETFPSYNNIIDAQEFLQQQLPTTWSEKPRIIRVNDKDFRVVSEPVLLNNFLNQPKTIVEEFVPDDIRIKPCFSFQLDPNYSYNQDYIETTENQLRSQIVQFHQNEVQEELKPEQLLFFWYPVDDICRVQVQVAQPKKVFRSWMDLQCYMTVFQEFLNRHEPLSEYLTLHIPKDNFFPCMHSTLTDSSINQSDLIPSSTSLQQESIIYAAPSPATLYRRAQAGKSPWVNLSSTKKHFNAKEHSYAVSLVEIIHGAQDVQNNEVKLEPYYVRTPASSEEQLPDGVILFFTRSDNLIIVKRDGTISGAHYYSRETIDGPTSMEDEDAYCDLLQSVWSRTNCIKEVMDFTAIIQDDKQFIVRQKVDMNKCFVEGVTTTEQELIKRFKNKPYWYSETTKKHGTKLKRGNPVEAMMEATDSEKIRYDAVFFSPGLVQRDMANSRKYNLWSGWTIQAKENQAKIQKILDHILKIWCKGNLSYYEYIIGWMAHSVQKPWEKPGVAIALYGSEGVGKGIIVQIWLDFFGPYGLQLVSSKHLTGNFNEHLCGKIALFADESIWGGNKQEDGALKALITEKRQVIEKKFGAVFEIESCTHLFIATNNDWYANPGPGGRRFFCLNVSADKMGDHKYFDELRHDINTGGREAFLYYLLKYDLSRFNVRNMPRTEEYLRQVKKTNPFIAWWWECCEHQEFIGMTEEDKTYKMWYSNDRKRILVRSEAVFVAIKYYLKERCKEANVEELKESFKKVLNVVKRKQDIEENMDIARTLIIQAKYKEKNTSCWSFPSDWTILLKELERRLLVSEDTNGKPMSKRARESTDEEETPSKKPKK